jgi:hypothetical protein
MKMMRILTIRRRYPSQPRLSPRKSRKTKMMMTWKSSLRRSLLLWKKSGRMNQMRITRRIRRRLMANLTMRLMARRLRKLAKFVPLSENDLIKYYIQLMFYLVI